MSQPELLKRVIAVLATGGIEYMVTGSLVSSSQGEPLFELQFKSLDLRYIEQWVAKLNLTSLWQRVQDEANPLQED